MKKYIYTLLVFALLGSFAFVSCEGPENPIFDAENGRAIAGFNNADSPLARIVFNPAEDTDNFIELGVSTVSGSPRTAQLEIDLDETTLDARYYEISTLTPVIEAGDFVTTVNIKTIAQDELPGVNDVIVLKLVSVQNAEIGEASEDELTIGLNIECPSVEVSEVVGQATTVTNELLVAFGVPGTFSDPRTVLAGPGDNQITIVGGLSSDVGGTDIVLDIDPETGNVTDAAPGGTSFVNGGTPIPTTNITGRVLTCINQIDIVVQNATFGPPFNAFRMVLQVEP